MPLNAANCSTAHVQVNHCSFVQKSELESGQHVFTAGRALGQL